MEIPLGGGLQVGDRIPVVTREDSRSRGSLIIRSDQLFQTDWCSLWPFLCPWERESGIVLKFKGMENKFCVFP